MHILKKLMCALLLAAGFGMIMWSNALPVQAAHTHNWVVGANIAASCSKAGKIISKCSECKQIKTETIAQKPHSFQTIIDRCAKPAPNADYGRLHKQCTVCGHATDYDYIPYPSTMTLSYTSTSYTGEALRPTVTIKDCKGNVISSKYYTLKYSNNTNPGKANVTVTFKTRMTGSLSASFLIKPLSPKTLTASYVSTAQMKLSWSKVTGTSGYVVEYSTKNSFPKTGETCVKYVDSTTTGLTVKNLAKKTYYVRVAAYTKKDGSICPGKYSPVKTVNVTSGASLSTLISTLKSSTANKSGILKKTNNQVDISKYSNTTDRFKALYTWHAKNSGKFKSCYECNKSFLECVRLLINEKSNDHWLWISCDNYRNNSGSVVMHKWATIYLQGVPYQFDPRMQGNMKTPTSFSYYAFTYGSTIGKHYIVDGLLHEVK